MWFDARRRRSLRRSRISPMTDLSGRRKCSAGWWMLAILLCAGAGVVSAQTLKPWGGKATPVIELADPEGRKYRLADFRGQVVLVNFWATWCEPCRDEMPSMQRLKRRFDGRPFAVVAVNVGESEARIGEFLQKLPLDFVILRDHSSAAMKAWGARGLPASFIVGRDGRVRYSHIGELNWDDPRLAATVEGLLR
ncbi:MAG: TlpA family protein disulfide reductase [Betaproteobacteria bacterium]|nr:TlpA family protein disulfide reductase [Betaproteobacteria bacterium]